ncbi:hypothetical protein [Streptomyces fumanus]|uniref:Secreted protein n=1 Tax=Streptomyces fumanus TaxID=67302 RepID=A0A919A1R7_9ACTN|nr:hypothetical protein [Streptomyces fumanus]GHE83194.1 hypothetical protein GCM10018772_01860 [Streptomyces fumanus]
MKSWRSRVAVAVAAGAALVAVPLTAEPASAATNPWGYVEVGGTRDKLACVRDGQELLAQGWVNYYCDWDDPYWVLWALPAKDQPPTPGG